MSTVLKYIIANWKTSAGGIALILGAVSDVLSFAAKGELSPNLNTDLTALVSGVGLIAAKDLNVHGGGTPNASKS